MTPQAQTAANVAARGYRAGWAAQQFAARQVAKLVEELGELVGAVKAGARQSWQLNAEYAARQARRAFDQREPWNSAEIDIEAARQELADLQVVVFCLAEALSELSGEPLDVAQAAIEKSATDVRRGVR